MLFSVLGYKFFVIYSDFVSGNICFVVFVYDLFYFVSLRIDLG